jgi:hypothetical protein
MADDPVISVYISVAHVVDDMPTIAHISGYAVPVSAECTTTQARESATLAALKFGEELSRALAAMPWAKERAGG